MIYSITTTEEFERDYKILLKKYRSLRADVETLKEELLKNPQMGDKVFGNMRKVRMAITSKGKGKSGGARVITHTVIVSISAAKIRLLTIYDKSERDTISDKELAYLKKV
jgi:hypothetical protein